MSVSSLRQEIGQIRAKLMVTNMIIRDAQRDGDERWRTVAEQQRELNRQHAEKMKELRAVLGQPEPEPVVVQMKPAKLKAKRLAVGG